MSDPNTMINNFENLLAKGQDNALLRYSLGNAYLQKQALPTAIEHFAKAVNYDPKYSAAWKSYGKALAENQQTNAAIAVYQQGIATAEENGDIQAAKEMKVFLKRLQKTSS